ncbi:hypothetical protein ACFQAQ_23635 [Novosphingobium resinovorum]|uniref:hypothetical protein n=1 Tax=Novosphingobium resinovorum TaxID=158500 RepID=UPI00361B01DF
MVLIVRAFMARVPSPLNVRKIFLAFKAHSNMPNQHALLRYPACNRALLSIAPTIALLAALPPAAAAQQPIARDAAQDAARRAAIHPVADAAAMQAWLARVPVTRSFPNDLAATLDGHGPAFIIEMTTSAGCIPCGDLWAKLSSLAARHGWRLRTMGSEDAMIRSGRLGLPWAGHPVAWVRPVTDPWRAIPIAVGTDHTPNLARNLYLAAKMLTGGTAGRRGARNGEIHRHRRRGASSTRREAAMMLLRFAVRARPPPLPLPPPPPPPPQPFP